MTNVEEAVKWLSYTYLYVRMRYNPLAYGISITEAQEDPGLDQKRRDLILTAGRSLDKSRMVRFEERTGYFSPTDLGRTSSHFYIKFGVMPQIMMTMVGLVAHAFRGHRAGSVAFIASTGFTVALALTGVDPACHCTTLTHS